LTGSYLAACVFYTSLFHKSSFGSAYNPGIDHADALLIQQIASAVVLDSLSTWKLIHSDSTLQASASYSSIPSASLLSFSATANKAANFTWYFPDGSIETGPTIGFEYNLSSYQVLLVAEGLCDTDSVLIEVTNPNAGLSATAALQWKMTGPNSIEIEGEKIVAAEAFDLLGRKCPIEIENNGANSVLSFSNYASFIKMETTNGTTTIRVPIFLH
jgi:hypothetical protein